MLSTVANLDPYALGGGTPNWTTLLALGQPWLLNPSTIAPGQTGTTGSPPGLKDRAKIS